MKKLLILVGVFLSLASSAQIQKTLMERDSITKYVTPFQLRTSGSMVYPTSGIPISTSTTWGASITNNSANWNTAFGWGNHAGLYPLVQRFLDSINAVKNLIPVINYPVTSVAGRTGNVTLVKSDVGLTNVDNTTDLLKPVSTATQNVLNLKMNYTDSINLSNRINQNGADILLRVKYSDTASMLSNYRTSYQPIGSYATTSQNALKLNISDTASMLANYRTSYQPIGSYATTTQNNLKVNISDTSAMLAKYRDTLAAHNLRIGSNTTNISANTTAITTKQNTITNLADTSKYIEIADSILSYQYATNYDLKKSKDSVFALIPAVSDATITTTDITTNNFTTAKHGFVPKGTNVGNFLKDDGTWATVSGSGTVTTVSVVGANGFAGSVANPATTPAITLSTSVTGIIKGNGTSISAATAGTDYITPTGTETLTNKIVNNQSLLNNYSTSDQTIGAATTALLTGSTLTIPSGKLQIGTVLKFTISVSKTAAGTAANIFLVKIGTTGTTSDATILTFTTGTGTAAVDVGTIDIFITIRGPLSSSCIAQGNFRLTHNLSSTGLLVVAGNSINATSSGFDATATGLIASVTCTTAALTVLTFQQVVAEVINL